MLGFLIERLCCLWVDPNFSVHPQKPDNPIEMLEAPITFKKLRLFIPAPIKRYLLFKRLQTYPSPWNINNTFQRPTKWYAFALPFTDVNT